MSCKFNSQHALAETFLKHYFWLNIVDKICSFFARFQFVRYEMLMLKQLLATTPKNKISLNKSGNLQKQIRFFIIFLLRGFGRLSAFHVSILFSIENILWVITVNRLMLQEL